MAFEVDDRGPVTLPPPLGVAQLRIPEPSFRKKVLGAPLGGVRKYPVSNILSTYNLLAMLYSLVGSGTIDPPPT